MTDQKPQSDKFKEADRDLETDNEEKRFDRLLGKIAKAKKPDAKKAKIKQG